jgi:hypothetical protein
LPGDCCAILNLSIAIKTPEHYDKCLEAKILELESSFQAKLGWLVGQLYSRVGTQDWPTDRLTPKVRSALKDVAIWVPDAKLDALVTHARQTLAENPDAILTAEEAATILGRIPGRKKQVMQRVNAIINEALGTQNDEHRHLAEMIKKRLESDLALISLLK